VPGDQELDAVLHVDNDEIALTDAFHYQAACDSRDSVPESEIVPRFRRCIVRDENEERVIGAAPRAHFKQPRQVSPGKWMNPLWANGRHVS
jgi:hypothetical protein